MVDYERLMEEDGPDPATVLADRGRTATRLVAIWNAAQRRSGDPDKIETA
jgi:hypothetical protein